MLHIHIDDMTESATRRRTRERIFQTAYSEFAGQGPEATTMVEISRKAGITRRTLYNYFETMEDLVAEMHPLVLSQLVQDIRREYTACASSGDSLTARLQSCFVMLTRFFESDLELVHYVIGVEHFAAARSNVLSLEDTLIERLLTSAPVVAIFTRMVETGDYVGDPHLIARVFFTTFVGHLERISYRSEVLEDEGYDRSHSFLQVLDLMIRGIAGGSHAA